MGSYKKDTDYRQSTQLSAVGWLFLPCLGAPLNLPRLHEVPGRNSNNETLMKGTEVSFAFIPNMLYRFWFSAPDFVSC